MNINFFVLVTIISLTLPAHALRFDRACETGETITIGAVGDVLLHQPLQTQGYSQGFDSIWGGLDSYYKMADIMYANYEGPSAEGVNRSGRKVEDPGPVFNKTVYSGYPLFNYHKSSIEGLKQSGFDILSTANNHSLDRGALGAQLTIDAMNDVGIDYFGTRQNADGAFYKVTDNAGWKIAWIACAYDTNGIKDNSDLVLDCFDSGRVSKYIKELKNSVDAVIVTPHWGEQYHDNPNDQQMKFGRRWLEEGATAVIGSHPHVPQTWEKHVTADGREGLILYSLGNFVSNQTPVVKQSTLLLYVGLSKNNGKTWVNGVRYLPLYMKRKPWKIVVSNSGEDTAGIAASLKHVKKMYGAERIVEPGEEVITNAECF